MKEEHPPAFRGGWFAESGGGAGSEIGEVGKDQITQGLVASLGFVLGVT